MAEKLQKCPKCRNFDLSLREFTELCTTWDGIDAYQGKDEGYHEPSSITGIDWYCNDCGHQWKVRKKFMIDDDLKTILANSYKQYLTTLD